MLRLTKTLPIVGAVASLGGGVLEGPLWIAGGVTLLYIAPGLLVVRAIALSREPPTIGELLDAAEGVDDPHRDYSHGEAEVALGDRGSEYAKISKGFQCLSRTVEE